MSEIQSSCENRPQPFPLHGYTEPARRRATILVVEDEALVRESTCEVLENEGYRVLKARNAIEARGALRRERKRLRLLLTDVVLPGENGKELAKQVRSTCPGVGIIFVSGYPENAVTRGGSMEAGTFYLAKPYTAESLVRKVRQVLAKEIEDVAV